MAGSSIWDYVFIRACIFVLHLVAPLSTVYSLVSLFVTLQLHVPRMLQIWLALEALFYLLFYHPRRAYLQAAARHPATASRDARRRLFRRCHSNIPDPNRYLMKWFLDAPAVEIKRENVKEFYRWAFLNTAEPDPTCDEELEEYAAEMETLLGREFEPGRGNARCLRLSLDKVEMLHRSLTWYLCVFIVDTIATAYLHYYRFDFYRSSMRQFLSVFPLRPLTLFTSRSTSASALTYWHRPHNSKTRLPILFIHGIGIGLYPYIDFLVNLNAADDQELSDGQVGIIAIEILSVSSRITAEAMLKDDISEEIRRILKAHGWEKVVLVSHSYGSVVAAHILRTPQLSELIGPLFFVDPVSFLLHLPDVAYNFVYRKPTHATEYQLSYFGAKDMGVSHTLFRRFFWADNILWKEDLRGHRVAVVLAGKDAIVDTKAVAAYLAGNDNWDSQAGGSGHRVLNSDRLDVLWFRDLGHGQVFDSPATRGEMVNVIRGFCTEK